MPVPAPQNAAPQPTPKPSPAGVALPEARLPAQEPGATQQTAESQLIYLPWKTATGELQEILRNLQQLGPDSGIRREQIAVDGKLAATVTTEPVSMSGPGVIVEVSKPQLTVTEDGVFVGPPSRSAAQKPDATFREDAFGPTRVGVVTQSPEVEVTYLPVSGIGTRSRPFPATTLMADAALMRVTDQSGVAQSFSVAKDQTLILTLSLPTTPPGAGVAVPGESRLPNVAGQKFDISYWPSQQGNIEGLVHPETNFVNLPNGSQVMMQPGAKLQVQYQTPSGLVPVLDYRAIGAVTEGQLEHASRAGEVFRECVAKRDEGLLEAQRGSALVRAEAERTLDSRPRIPTSTEHERDGIYEGRLTIGDTQDYTVVSPPRGGVELALQGDRVVLNRADLRVLTTLKRGDREEGNGHAKLPLPPGTPLNVGDPIRNGVLVVDNSGSGRTTIDLTGTGRTVELQTPIHVISRGALEVDLRGGRPDHYVSHPLTLSAGTADTPQPIQVTVDRSVETGFFSQGDALRNNPRWHAGIITDASGKVTGFQPTENGPRIELRPGQTLTFRTDRSEVLGRANPFANNDSLFIHQPHEYHLTGGKTKTETIQDLDQQHQDELRRFPTIEIEQRPIEKLRPREEGFAQMVLPPRRDIS
ncbi:MAG: hypothetical protein U0136_09920 [Bdellovibrionota bacterium]